LRDDDPRRLDLGVLKGTQAAAHVVLHVDSALTLHIAGHVLPLGDVLAWADRGMTVERRALVRCVDNPVAAAGDKASRQQRIDRLRARRNQFRFPDLGGVLRQSSGIRCGTLFDQARGCSWHNLAPHVAKECEGVETVVASGFS
jgi:hypothetical protein